MTVFSNAADRVEDLDAAAILAMVEAKSPLAELDEETRAAIKDGLEQARRGEFVPDRDIEAIWKRHGL